MSLLPQQTQKLIDERIDQMPLAFQDVLKEFDWQTEIQNVAAKHRLTADQGTKLIVETSMVMIGVENPAIFRDNIVQNLGIAPVAAKAIAEDLKSHIFDRMQSALLASNKDHIENLQNQLAQLEREQTKADLAEHAGIEVMDEESSDEEKIPVVGTIDLSALSSLGSKIPTPPRAPAYKEKDPYHEEI